MPEQPVWDGYLSTRDREVLVASGYGQPRELTQPAALLVVDMTFDFLGDRREDILTSIRRYPNSCGDEGWDAAERLAPVIEKARQASVAVIYTARSLVHPLLEELSWGSKQRDAGRPAHSTGTKFPPAIEPAPGDIVIHKTKPSGFFGTPLREYLTGLGIRQLLIAGATTSGCVRATVVDAFSYGFAVAVIADCVVDRISVSHAIGLFDMQAKYADLLSATDAVGFLDSMRGPGGPR